MIEEIASSYDGTVVNLNANGAGKTRGFSTENAVCGREFGRSGGGGG